MLKKIVLIVIVFLFILGLGDSRAEESTGESIQTHPDPGRALLFNY